jgi:ketosteroid isomerase-like protein
MSNKQIIEAFYTAFANADSEAMVSLYDDKIKFSDPAFGPLNGEQAKNMWRMLVRPGIDIKFSNVQSAGNKGSADWVAIYTFSTTGRTVRNKIHAEFEFYDGKITRHNDTFNMWKWSAQALGLKGLLLGWTYLLRSKIRENANAQLRKFTEKVSKVEVQ